MPKFLHLTPTKPSVEGKIRVKLDHIISYQRDQMYGHETQCTRLYCGADCYLYVEETPEEIDKLLDFVDNSNQF